MWVIETPTGNGEWEVVKTVPTHEITESLMTLKMQGPGIYKVRRHGTTEHDGTVSGRGAGPVL